MNLLPFRDALRDGLALVLPVDCAGCGARDRSVCDVCRAALTPDPSARRLANGVPVFTGLDYEGVARAVILAYKEQGRTELASVLAPALAAAVREAGDTLDLRGVDLVAVPGSRRARRRRGFDPVGRLVVRAGLDPARVFAPARPHSAQKSLSLDQRQHNLENVFQTRMPVTGRRFLLIDDVVTTGATLEAAASALHASGAEVVAAAAVASTPRRHGSLARFQGERSGNFS